MPYACSLPCLIRYGYRVDADCLQPLQPFPESLRSTACEILRFPLYMSPGHKLLLRFINMTCLCYELQGANQTMLHYYIGLFPEDDLLGRLTSVDVPLSYHLDVALKEDFLGNPFIDEMKDTPAGKLMFFLKPFQIPTTGLMFEPANIFSL